MLVKNYYPTPFVIIDFNAAYNLSKFSIPPESYLPVRNDIQE